MRRSLALSCAYLVAEGTLIPGVEPHCALGPSLQPLAAPIISIMVSLSRAPIHPIRLICSPHFVPHFRSRIRSAARLISHPLANAGLFP